MKKYIIHLLIFALVLSIGGNIYFFVTDEAVKEECQDLVETEYIYQDISILKEEVTSLYNAMHIAMHNNSAPNSVDLIYFNDNLSDEYKNLLVFGSLYDNLKMSSCTTENCFSYSVDLNTFEVAFEKMFGNKTYSKVDFYGDKNNVCKFENDKINCYYNSLLENWDSSYNNPYFESYIINQLVDITVEDDYIIVSEKHLDVVIVGDDIDVNLVDDKNENIIDKYLDEIENNTLTDSDINDIFNDNINSVEEFDFYFKINNDGTVYFEKINEK